MATIYIENKPYEVDENENILQACLSLGFNLPYFCYHPAMGSVGACRQCAVKKFKDENDKQGKIVMACMEPVSDGTRISINDPEVVEFRRSVIEWLMENHPHDCPICDEGGECHLQDMTVMTGHNYRRYRFKKRTFRNQYLGPFINHEMNRCIQCYRCVRFYNDYAGGKDLHAFASGNRVYFGRHSEGALENEFSGNLVEVCPTGVFTDKTLKKHYTRKWDLQAAPSICTHCGLGCNIITGEKYGSLRRILSRYNGEVNGYFICDRGRFGYEFVNSDKRIRQSLISNHDESKFESVSKDTILQYVEKIISSGKNVIGIGSPRASLESNFALRKLVGSDNFYTGIPEKQLSLISSAIEIYQNSAAKAPSLKETEKADAVFVLGEDCTNTAPMLALALRQAVLQQPKERAANLKIPLWNDAAVRELIQDQKGPFTIATPDQTKLDEIATETVRAVPDDIARLGFAVAHAIHSGAPAVADLTKEEENAAKRIAEALKKADQPLIVTGISLNNKAILHAAANITLALHQHKKQTDLCITVPESNSMGLGLLGGDSLNEAFSRAEKETIDTVVILENDLYQRSDAPAIEKFWQKCNHTIVLDQLSTATTTKAEVVLPVGTFAESDGTFVNNEGRAQRFYRSYLPAGDIQDSWRWLRDMMIVAKITDVDWNNLDDVINAFVSEVPIFSDIQKIAPPASFRKVGQKIPRQPHRYSGRTAMLANVSVHEPKPPDDPDSALSFSMEGFKGKPPSSIIPFFWSPAWNSVQSINKFQNEVGGHLHDGDPGKRLIEPLNDNNPTFFKQIPAAFKSKKDEMLFVPLYHIFGTEELSKESPAIAERVPQPYISMNLESAANLDIKEGEKFEFTLLGKTLSLPVKLSQLPTGVAGLPIGIIPLPGDIFPVWNKITKAKK